MGNQESNQMDGCMMDISQEENLNTQSYEDKYQAILDRPIEMDLTVDDQPPIPPLIIQHIPQLPPAGEQECDTMAPARTLELSISFNEESLEHKRDNNPYEHLFIQDDSDIYPPMNDEDDHLWDYPPEAEDEEHGFNGYFDE
jgi:hypothetical protein